MSHNSADVAFLSRTQLPESLAQNMRRVAFRHRCPTASMLIVWRVLVSSFLLKHLSFAVKVHCCSPRFREAMTKRTSDQYMEMADDDLEYELENIPVTESCDVVR
jgi:hypothetical protein